MKNPLITQLAKVLCAFCILMALTACATEVGSQYRLGGTYDISSPEEPLGIDSDDSARSINVSTGCHESYSGCLKSNATDYDCAGGSGDGPYYTGPVEVFGIDVFDLDRDNDGWGCE
jgi:hypothetical protein